MTTRTGIEKAAVLLASLPRELAEKLLAALGPARGDRLRIELEKLRQQGERPSDVNEVLREFEELLRQPDAPPPPPPPPVPTPRQLAAYQPPSDADIFLPEEPTPAPLPSDPVKALHVLSPELLAAVLQGEQAHTIALVLNELPPEKGGEVLRLLPPELRRDVSVRITRLNGSSPELLARIAVALVQRSRKLSGKPNEGNADAKYEKIASMLRCLANAERLEVLTALEESDPETAGRVRELLYTFEDLLRVHDRSLQKILGEVDSKTLSVALKGANEAINEKLLTNLSKRAREALKEEMEFVGIVPLAQVRQAQKMIVDVMLRLNQSGELMMSE
jgi:flagellar motor switch protein FliG